MLDSVQELLEMAKKVKYVLPKKQLEEIIHAVRDLEKLENVNSLAALLVVDQQ